VLVACGSPQGGGDRERDGGDGDGDGDGDSGPSDGCGGETCDEHASCIGSASSERSCMCDAGYEGDGETCTDIDECEGDNDCASNADCTNTDGSYSCACQDGFTGDGQTCTAAGCDDLICDPNATCGDGAGCECGPGYEGDGEGCGDVDECEADDFECASDAACVNTFGGYDCECEPLFAGNGKTSCQPLCEIALADTSVCDADGVCRIDRDAAVCDACAPGFEGNGRTCTANAAACGAQCDGTGSDDEDHAVCDGEGGCECAPGWDGAPGSCADVDECDAPSPCSDNATCINTDGGFFCACESGFAKDDNGECVDKDECEDGTSLCHPNATCTNTAGSFTCECKDGYEGDGSVCRDTNECDEDDACEANATCTNTKGSFECSCEGDFAGDDPTACYCDLSGTWAMRQDVDTCWDQLNFEGTEVALISQGQMEATVWELHKLSYDGEVITVEKKGCSTDNAPDLESPFFSETYSSYIPDSLFDQLGLQPGNDINEAGIVPGRMFTTDPEAAVIGVELGDDVLRAPWPASRDDINDEGAAVPAWTDTDKDGTPGVTVWPRLPTQTPDSGSGKYSYLPVTPSGTMIDKRAGCVSVAARVISHLEIDVQDCRHMIGEVFDDGSQGRVYGCTRVSLEDELDPITCDEADWSSMDMCDSADIMRLDSDENQEQVTKTTFELVRIGDLDDDVSCFDVRDQLPAFERETPTITCRD
jgi:hypothetical protein